MSQDSWKGLDISASTSQAWTTRLFMEQVGKGHIQHRGFLKSPSLILPSLAVGTEGTAGKDNSSSQSLKRSHCLPKSELKEALARFPE